MKKKNKQEGKNDEPIVVSAFEYAIREIADKTAEEPNKHTKGYRARTPGEERARQNEDLRKQLSNMQVIKPGGKREDIDVDYAMEQISKAKRKEPCQEERF